MGLGPNANSLTGIPPGIGGVLAGLGPSPNALSGFGQHLQPVRRRIFVSYHHGGDRRYYDEFSKVFCDSFEAAHDNSVDRVIDSDDSDNVMRSIRENFLRGSSCTIVLCGAETHKRKFVDWEIKATLDRQHGLIGVNLPTNPACVVPHRFYDNWWTGYAVWVQWSSLLQLPAQLAGLIEIANSTARALINNTRPTRGRNG